LSKSISLSSWILSVEDRSCFLFTSCKTIGRCLLRAGPKLFDAFLYDDALRDDLAYFKFSMAAMNIALFDEVRHF
jgi:hypothetical protein